MLDLTKRQQELDKLNALDMKIARELKSLRDKMTTMGEEMETFKKIDELKEDAAERKQVRNCFSLWDLTCLSLHYVESSRVYILLSVEL